MRTHAAQARFELSFNLGRLKLPDEECRGASMEAALPKPITDDAACARAASNKAAALEKLAERKRKAEERKRKAAAEAAEPQ